MAAVHPRRVVLLLRLGRLALGAPADGVERRQHGGGAGDLHQPLAGHPQARADRRDRVRPRAPLRLQVPGLLRLGDGRRARVDRARLAAPAGSDRAADRDLVLHVPGDLVRRRRVPRRHPRGIARGGGDPPGVLPASRGGADRARRGAAAAAPHPARPARRAGRARDLPGRRRLPEEDGDRRRAGAERGGPRVQRPGRPFRRRADARVLRVRRADLLRLLGLHGHGDRARAAPRLPAPAELQPALHGALAARLLAPLAHDAVALAARLPLHPARRQPRRARADVSQPDDHDAARRPLARGGLDVPASGAASTAPPCPASAGRASASRASACRRGPRGS